MTPPTLTTRDTSLISIKESLKAAAEKEDILGVVSVLRTQEIALSDLQYAITASRCNSLIYRFLSALYDAMDNTPP